MKRANIAALVGVVVVAGHAAGFAMLAGRSAGTELAVELAASLASPRLALDGQVPAALADRVTSSSDGDGPGLRRRRWTIAYRGGFARAVGASQLVGPFQEPHRRACTGRVVMGQRLLDDGHAGPGTAAGAMAKLLDSELRGETIFPIGAYKRIDQLSLRWARIENHFFDRGLLGAAGAPEGYVRATTTVVFERVAVPLVVLLVPERVADKLHFRIAARAELAFKSAALQWISDKLDGDKLATRLANRQLDDVLVTTLAPPPPFALPEGQTLTFTYCDGPVEIADGAWGALPFGVAIGSVPGAPEVLPPHFAPRDGRGTPVRRLPAPSTALAIDLDLDALDAMLFELWRTGWLDRQLAAVGLDRHFNTDPTVTEYLSIRISPVRLALPPVIEADRDALRLSADGRVAISDDGGHVTTGRLFGALDLRFAPGGAGSADLGGLELACERTPTTLVPCYADLVAAIAGRGTEFHGALSDAFDKLVTEIFVDRHLSAGDLGADLAIHGATTSLAPNAQGLHLELDASIDRPR